MRAPLSGLLALSIGASATASDPVYIQVDPQATYFHTNNDFFATDAIPVALGDLGVNEFDWIRIRRIGDWHCGSDACNDEEQQVFACFSGSDELRSSNFLNRIRDAIDAGIDFPSELTFFDDEETDIPEDFLVSANDPGFDTVTVQVPAGATHIFVSVRDTAYGDNTDPDGDLQLEVTRLDDSLDCNALDITSSDPAKAYPVMGTLQEQVAELMAGPPAYSDQTWSGVVRRVNDGTPATPLRCDCTDGPPDCVDYLVGVPLTFPFIETDDPLLGLDQVTFDNCSSAFYRWTFDLPAGASDPSLIGTVTADDQAAVYLNGVRISGLMTDGNCDPDPALGDDDPCYALQDAGSDSFDVTGVWRITMPTADTFATADSSIFNIGENELIFAVCGDAQWLDPTGIAFRATVRFAQSCAPPVLDEVYVSVDGSNGGSGTFDDPWRTIQHAVDSVGAGTVVWIRGGEYSERVTIENSGNAADGPIIVQGFPGETAILDGSNVTVPSGHVGLVLVDGADHVTIRNLHFRDYSTSNANRSAAAVHITGAAHHIEIRENVIYDIAHDNAADGGASFGIAVSGVSDGVPTHDITIADNELYDLQLGAGAAIVVDGNAEDFLIADNHIHDCDSYGIACYGKSGMSEYTIFDEARHGTIERNLIESLDASSNPAWSGLSAAGVLVDLGKDISVDRNTVRHCDVGVELGARIDGEVTLRVIVTSNALHDNRGPGVIIGGLAGDGRTRACRVVNNTLFRNDTDGTGDGEVRFRDDTRSNLVYNNIVVTGPSGVLVTHPFTDAQSNELDQNLYLTPGGTGAAQFEWLNVSYTGFNSWKNNTGFDADTVFNDPEFVDDGAVPDLRPGVSSPATDGGRDSELPAGAVLDLAGEIRSQGDAVDLGAYEAVGDCPYDIDGDDRLGTNDLLVILSAWGDCVPVGTGGDVDQDGLVGLGDLLLILGAWGSCD